MTELRRGKNGSEFESAGEGFSGREDERWLAMEAELWLWWRSTSGAVANVETVGCLGVEW